MWCETCLTRVNVYFLQFLVGLQWAAACESQASAELMEANPAIAVSFWSSDRSRVCLGGLLWFPLSSECWQLYRVFECWTTVLNEWVTEAPSMLTERAMRQFWPAAGICLAAEPHGVIVTWWWPDMGRSVGCGHRLSWQGGCTQCDSFVHVVHPTFPVGSFENVKY